MLAQPRWMITDGALALVGLVFLVGVNAAAELHAEGAAVDRTTASTSVLKRAGNHPWPKASSAATAAAAIARRGSTERVSVDSAGNQVDSSTGGHFLYSLAMSSDARYIAFGSSADNLVPGDTNAAGDVFVHDRRRKHCQSDRQDLEALVQQGQHNGGAPIYR